MCKKKYFVSSCLRNTVWIEIFIQNLYTVFNIKHVNKFLTQFHRNYYYLRIESTYFHFINMVHFHKYPAFKITVCTVITFDLGHFLFKLLGWLPNITFITFQTWNLVDNVTAVLYIFKFRNEVWILKKIKGFQQNSQKQLQVHISDLLDIISAVQLKRPIWNITKKENLKIVVSIQVLKPICGCRWTTTLQRPRISRKEMTKGVNMIKSLRQNVEKQLQMRISYLYDLISTVFL